jgi:hypothetical protein
MQWRGDDLTAFLTIQSLANACVSRSLRKEISTEPLVSVERMASQQKLASVMFVMLVMQQTVHVAPKRTTSIAVIEIRFRHR